MIREENIVSELDDRGFLNMLIMVIGALVAFFVIIIIIARMVAGDQPTGPVDKMTEAATIERIKPVGNVNVGDVPVVTASASADPKASYTASCAACHDTGAAGAPKVGDKGAWKSRIGLGMSKLVSNAINGKGGMPPRGGSSLDDDQMEAVVKYMVNNSK